MATLLSKFSIYSITEKAGICNSNLQKQEVFSIAQYIPFTEEQKLRAGAVDLEEFLRLRGEKLIRSGRDKRLASDHSVTVRGSSWYDHAAQRGGGPVSFLRRFYRMSYPEAMQTLLGGNGGQSFPAASKREAATRKDLALPEANGDMRRVYAYLIKQRHIGKDVIDHFAKAGALYEDAKHHNAVFVGTDESGIPRHAHKRSTNSYGKAFRINVEGSDPRYSFHHVGTDGSLFVFEAPIDMLSYVTLHPDRWQEHSYVACCGTSFLPVQQMKEMTPPTERLFLCLDNDEAGRSACERMEELSRAWNVETERLLSEHKDWNEDLVQQDQTQEMKPICQTMYCL